MSEVSSTFIHPGEAKILEDIIKIANQHKEIRKFILKYNGTSSTSSDSSAVGVDGAEEPLGKGMYLQAFCNGMDKALEKYRCLVVDLEKRYLRTPTHSLLFIYHQIDRFQPLFFFLLKLISGVRTQRLHGCMILDFLQKNSLHGNNNICEAVQIIQRSVYVVFIKQLYQWLIYGKPVDPYGEFFIQQIDETASKTANGPNSIQNTYSTPSETTSVNTELWRYEVSYVLLPYYFPTTWAENVLLSGQTVLAFNSYPKDIHRRLESLDEPDEPPVSLWGDQEYEIFRKFQELQKEEVINVGKLEQIVNVIKSCVTEHLFKISMRDADLCNQMKLIKDFYLLGRGEMYHEFVKLARPLTTKKLSDGSQRELNRAFSIAAASVNVSDDAEQFTFMIPKENLENYEQTSSSFFNSFILKYKVKWPLHLLFSPKVLDRYNEMFRFLLRIKMTQYDLQGLWGLHRDMKYEKNNEVVLFRSKLQFLIDNLQYYLQVDVLESQFSILMTAIQEAKDFTHIQKAHAMFQGNVMTLCFLVPITDTSKSIGEEFMVEENPVLKILNKILDCVHTFCSKSQQIQGTPLAPEQRHEFQSKEEE